MRPDRCRVPTPALASGYGRQNNLAAPMISERGDADCNCFLPQASPFDGVIIWVLGQLALTNGGTGITCPAGHAACTFGWMGAGRNSVLVLFDDGGTCRSNVLALLDWFSHEDPNGQLLLSTGKARLSVAALRQTAFLLQFHLPPLTTS
jgi:hypothetical protein